MGNYIITIDGGTTNTRAFLWSVKDPVSSLPLGAALCGSRKSTIGVSRTAEDGHNGALKEAVRGMLSVLLEEAAISWSEIRAVCASGMITSNVGLYELPHLIAPAGLADFAKGIHEELIPDVCPIPISFIPGLKNMPSDSVTPDNLEQMDIMRGEETEALALLHLLQSGSVSLPVAQAASGGVLLVLPGSHTKFISVDADGRLTGCLTSLAGEMLSLLTNHSIVADSVARSFTEVPDEEYLIRGFDAARATSLTRAGFLTRIVGQFLSKDPLLSQSFLLGAVLENDIEAIKKSQALSVNPAMQVLIAGKPALSLPLKTLFAYDGYFSDVQVMTPDDALPLSGIGALLVASQIPSSS